MIAWVLAGIVTISSLTQAVPLFTSDPTASFFTNGLVLLVTLALRPAFSFLAALIVSRQPRNAVGWLLFFPATIDIFNVLPYIHSFTAAPQAPPLRLLLSLWYATTSWLQLIFPIFFIMVLFPTGRPPSPRWRWLIAAGLGMCAFFLFLVTFGRTYSAVDVSQDWAITNPIGFIELGANTDLFFVIWGIGLISIAILSVVSLVVRYRSATSIEREQIKWLLFACAVFAALYGTAYPINTLPEWAAYRPVANSLWQISMIGIPLAIAIAILRYRLFDIDLIIRRTLQYGLLSVLLGLVYYGLVVVLGQVFQGISGQQSPLVVVISTLAIAALFSPLRRRLQTIIDRRFYRSKYDAEETLAHFAARLQNEVDLDEIQRTFIRMVDENIQPERTALWLVKGRLGERDGFNP